METRSMMDRVLALSYRPKTFTEMVGQKKVTAAIIKQYASKREPSSWLFVGEPGAGKTTLARILALSLQCDHNEMGSPCFDCQESRTSFEIAEINAAEHRGVEDMQRVADMSSYAPVVGRRRVFILDEAQRLSKEAQSLLLKHLEDTPRSTVWIICTTEPEKLSAAVRRRCIDLAMVPLTRKGIEILVKKAAASVKYRKDLDDFIHEVMTAKITSPGIIIKSLEKYISGISAEKAVAGGESTVNTMRLCKAVVAGDLEKVNEIMKVAVQGDVPLIIASVAGYLRAGLGRNLGAEKNRLWGIEKLSETTKLIEYMQLPHAHATLYDLTRKFQGEKKK